MTETDFGDIFNEPEDFRPKIPPPTQHRYKRKHTDQIIEFSLIGHHSLWAHIAWNAGIYFANYLDENPELCCGKNILELGAGAALPSMIAALNGAKKVIATDYPEPQLIQNLTSNIKKNLFDFYPETIEAMGYLWGSDSSVLLQKLENDEKFDLIFLCDLVFNHSQHDALLKTCKEVLRPQTGTIYCIFTHHRPWLAHKDLEIFEKSKNYGFLYEKMNTFTAPVMFEEDPGDEKVRQTIHLYKITWQS